jgi:hypothetical protein
MTYAAGEKVEYRCGGYILIGTVTESMSRGYMISGLTSRTMFIHQDDILGVFK